MKDLLIKYYRDAKGNPKGCVVARKDTEGVKIGYSLCCKRDTFCKKKGRNIAIARTYHRGSTSVVPDTLSSTVEHMIDRASKYFKSEVVV